MFPSTVERVPAHTSDAANRKIEERTNQNIRRFINADRESIDRRLEELDREWDIERRLEANAAIASLVGVTLGATVNRKFFALPAVVAAFLLQHAVQGWCPPLPVFRRLGVRTSYEIDRERYALKAIRGDFANVRRTKSPSDKRVREAIAAVEP